MTSAKAGEKEKEKKKEGTELFLDLSRLVEYPPLQVSSSGKQEGPVRLIMKDSWPLASRADNEGEMFLAVNGQFGVPEIIASYAVTAQHSNDPDDTSKLLPPKSEVWDVWSLGVANAVEDRRHMRIIIKTHGRPLTDAKGPKELVTGVLHAMLGMFRHKPSIINIDHSSIGHWALFDAGWLHRDISIGNVMLMQPPEPRPAVRGYVDCLMILELS